MVRENMSDNVFEKVANEPAVEPEKEVEMQVQAEQPSEPVKVDGLFTLKVVPVGGVSRRASFSASGITSDSKCWPSKRI